MKIINMDLDTRQIQEVQFGLYTPEEILAISQCEVNNGKREGHGSTYDRRMGAIDRDKCETCGENAKVCTGHFGHIELNARIIHPQYFKEVVNFLRCICMKCYKLLTSKEYIQLHGLNRYNGQARFLKIVDKIKTIETSCPHCHTSQAKIRHATTEEVIYRVRSTNSVKTQLPLTVDEIKRAFDNLTDDDVRLLGFNPDVVHPRSMILVRLLVMPQCARPYVKKDGDFFDDDFTNQYMQIIQANNKLALPDLTESKQRDQIGVIKFRIGTTFCNTKGRAKHPITGRAIRDIKSRVSGKTGQIRENLSGKRVDQSGRTVITPESSMSMTEVGIPINMANILTIPERVTPFNIKKLQMLVDTGEARYDEINQKVTDTGLVEYTVTPDGKTRYAMSQYRRGQKLTPGDIIFRDGQQIQVTTGRELALKGDYIERCGKPIDDLRHANRPYELQLGWIVERKLQNGDPVLINRQPTLHRGSMMAMRAKIMSGRTIRLNLAVTSSFNADFDGDEMNIHVVQSIPAQVELMNLCSTSSNMISARASKPNITIVQDSLLGAYQMTRGKCYIQKSEFFNICMKLSLTSAEVLERIEHIRKITRTLGKILGKSPYSGHSLISLILPLDFNYSKTTDANPNEPTVKIHRGVMYEGTMTKNTLGSVHNSIIQVLHKEYGSARAAQFVDEIQYITNGWLSIKGYSIGIKDCYIPEVNRDQEQKIKDTMHGCYMKADRIAEGTIHPGIREMRINAAMAGARDMGLRIAADALSPDNNFMGPVTSGSKGSFFNVTQVMGGLGQQNVNGGRIPLVMNNGQRSMVHYPFGELEGEMKYESRGFVRESFAEGLGPRSMWSHAVTGREGVTSTAMSTAESGYMQRRIVKVIEDCVVQYDNTVRDTTGRIFQFAYNEDNLDPVHTVRVNGCQESMNIHRMVDRLNTQFEVERKVSKFKLNRNLSKTRKCN